MKRREISIGSKKDSKRFKKEINLEVRPRHFVYAFIFLMLLVVLIHNILLATNIIEEELMFKCTNGSIEKIEYGKEVYCDQHYSETFGHLDFEDFLKIENIIKNGE